MAFKAKKSDDRPDHREKGTWKELKLSDGEVSATFVCPQCGTYGSLEDHQINGLGEVSPSVECDCGFHDFVVLDGWLGINGAHLTHVM